MIGVAMVHIWSVVDRHPQRMGSGEPDTHTMGVKEWTSLCKQLMDFEAVVRGTRGKQALPKPSDVYFAQAGDSSKSASPTFLRPR